VHRFDALHLFAAANDGERDAWTLTNIFEHSYCLAVKNIFSVLASFSGQKISNFVHLNLKYLLIQTKISIWTT
jgi:hypothetical protein